MYVDVTVHRVCFTQYGRCLVLVGRRSTIPVYPRYDSFETAVLMHFVCDASSTADLLGRCGHCLPASRSLCSVFSVYIHDVLACATGFFIFLRQVGEMIVGPTKLKLPAVNLMDLMKVKTLGTGTFGRVKLVQHKQTKHVRMFHRLKELRDMKAEAGFVVHLIRRVRTRSLVCPAHWLSGWSVNLLVGWLCWSVWWLGGRAVGSLVV